MRRGLPPDAFDGRPQIAIANTGSDLTPCNSHFDQIARSVERGVYEAGGIPLNLPVVSSARPWSGRPRCCGATSPRWRWRRCSAPTRSTGWCCSAAATRPSRRC
ncbi:dihydroxy-acid dehydratase domain-containing protein [Microlunatus endophyticus]